MGDPQCHHQTTYLYQTPDHIKTDKIICKLNTKKPNWDSIKELLVLCYYYQPGCRVWISPISLLLFPCQLLKPQLFDFSGQPLVSVNISITETKLPPMKTKPCYQALAMCQKFFGYARSLLERLDLCGQPVVDVEHGVLVLGLQIQEQSVLVSVTQRVTARVEHHWRNNSQTASLLLHLLISNTHIQLYV